jgi:hypothetical protein
MKMYKILPKGETSTQEINKQNLAKDFDMHSRDLRPIFLGRKQLYTISIRGNGIIVNLGKIKLCIGKSFAYFVSLQDDKRDNEFSLYLKKKLTNKKFEDKGIPFEFIILESSFEFVLNKFLKHFNAFEGKLSKILSSVVEKPTPENFEKLLTVKKEILYFEKTSQELQDSLNDLLNDDDTITELVLSNKEFEDDDLESILENLLEQVLELSHDIYKAKESIDDNQEIVTLKMATIRNSIIQLDLIVSLSMFILAFGTLITGFLGMNLFNSLENSKNAFGIIVILIIFISIFTGIFFWKYLKNKNILDKS